MTKKQTKKKDLAYYKNKCRKLEEKTMTEIIQTIFWTFVITCSIMLIIQGSLGTFKTPLTKLGIDKDYLAKEYIVKYYSEYENCSMIYFGEDEGDIEKVEVYCDTLNNRDGLVINKEKEPTEVILFEHITLEEIAQKKLDNREENIFWGEWNKESYVPIEHPYKEE